MRKKILLFVLIFVIYIFNANAQGGWYREGKIIDPGGNVITPPGVISPLGVSPLMYEVLKEVVSAIAESGEVEDNLLQKIADVIAAAEGESNGK